jgi:hypothetical protein
MLRLECAVSATVISRHQFSETTASQRHVTNILTLMPEHLSDYRGGGTYGCLEIKVQNIKLQVILHFEI